MKKLLALALALSMSLALVACGSEKKETEPETTTEAVETTPEAVEHEQVSPADETPAMAIVNKFQELANDGNEYTAFTMAEAICNANLVPVGLMPMEVEAGLLTGFENFEVTGFEEGTMFAPMISVQPFVAYIFTMPEGSDVEAFVADLESNANLRWNICTAADEMASDVVGNKVLFVMAPASFEE